MGQDSYRVFDAVIDDVLDLQFILVVRVRVRQRSKLLSQLETVRHVLWRHKVFSNLDTAVQVPHLSKLQLKIDIRHDSIVKIRWRIASHLVRGSGRYEDGVAQTLDDVVAPYSVLCVQSLPQCSVEIPALVVDRIVVRFQSLPAL